MDVVKCQLPMSVSRYGKNKHKFDEVKGVKC